MHAYAHFTPLLHVYARSDLTKLLIVSDATSGVLPPPPPSPARRPLTLSGDTMSCAAFGLPITSARPRPFLRNKSTPARGTPPPHPSLVWYSPWLSALARPASFSDFFPALNIRLFRTMALRVDSGLPFTPIPQKSDAPFYPNGQAKRGLNDAER
jgi:hypothetical protein